MKLFHRFLCATWHRSDIQCITNWLVWTQVLVCLQWHNQAFFQPLLRCPWGIYSDVTLPYLVCLHWHIHRRKDWFTYMQHSCQHKHSFATSDICLWYKYLISMSGLSVKCLPSGMVFMVLGGSCCLPRQGLQPLASRPSQMRSRSSKCHVKSK